MYNVTRITSAAAAAMVFVALPGGLYGQVTTDQDTARAPWDVRGQRPTFPGTPAPDTVVARNPTTPANPTTAAAVAADAAPIRQAFGGNVLEVRLGQVAEDRADDDDVEDFARRMIADHAAMGREWETLARNNRVTLATELSATEQRTVDRLDDLSGDDFDRAYMTEMIRHHEQDLAALQRMATTARSAEVRKLARTGVTKVSEHLTLAREVGRDVGVGAVANRDDDDRERNDRDRNDRTDLRGTDRAFIVNVLQDHLMHVRLAERAQREARSAETRRFAEDMEKEFSRWQERWRDLAERYDLKSPKGLGRLHEQKVERLERASRQELDRTYARIVADHLASVVPYFEKEGQAVRPAAARRLVDDELPVIREQLARARRLQR